MYGLELNASKHISYSWPYIDKLNRVTLGYIFNVNWHLICMDFMRYVTDRLIRYRPASSPHNWFSVIAYEEDVLLDKNITLQKSDGC